MDETDDGSEMNATDNRTDQQLLAEWRALREVELLLFREAELADFHRYDEWLALWAEDLLYWVPCNADDIDPERKISLIYEDRPKLEQRLLRLNTKHAHSQRPQSKLARTVSNVVLEDYDPARGGVAMSRFIVAELRLDQQTLWCGRMRHVLVRDDGALRIKEKHVFLVNNDAPMPNLTFII
jgi:3-phenylpropionate/cinnamic acid dioxygenase small subunit